MAARIPSTVQITEVSAPRIRERRTAARTMSFCSSTPNQRKLKPVMGKPPNWEALKDSSMVTMIGAKRKR